MPIQLPGSVIRRNSPFSDAVRAVQERLTAVGCGPVEVDGIFGPETGAPRAGP
jgi:peptidoglycan hydrolase-like protein with peptidoglycan-binding domain